MVEVVAGGVIALVVVESWRVAMTGGGGMGGGVHGEGLVAVVMAGGGGGVFRCLSGRRQAASSNGTPCNYRFDCSTWWWWWWVLGPWRWQVVVGTYNYRQSRNG